jgi:hypothetical protein
MVTLGTDGFDRSVFRSECGIDFRGGAVTPRARWQVQAGKAKKMFEELIVDPEKIDPLVAWGPSDFRAADFAGAGEVSRDGP